MPKKNGGHSTKKNTNISTGSLPTLFKNEEDTQEYARVVKVLGGGRYRVRLNMSDKELIGRLRGIMRKRKHQNWVGLDSVVLVSLRDFQDNVVDIIHVYSDQDVRRLKKSKVFIEEVTTTAEDNNEDVEDIGFEFEDI